MIRRGRPRRPPQRIEPSPELIVRYAAVGPSGGERGLLNEARILAAASPAASLRRRCRARRPQSAADRRPTARRRADRPRQPVRGGAAAARPGAERSRSSRSIRNAPPFPPVPGPVEDTPLGDPALTEPLPPLSDASTSSRSSEAGAAPTTASEPPPVRYTLVVEGMDETGLEGRFRDLSALEDAEGEAVNGAMIAAPRRGGRGARRPPAPLRRLL